MDNFNHDPLLSKWIQSLLSDSPAAVRDFEQTLHDNPGRISRAYRELLSGYQTVPSTLLKAVLTVKSSESHGLVSALRIPFLSFCAHHFLPFFGTVDVVYDPGAFIIGIGKLPRLVSCHAKRFQLQELLVQSICKDLMLHAGAKGAYVRAMAQHTCVCFRGPEASSVQNRTAYGEGTCVESPRLYEVLSLLEA
jgi:GTP cyclohydrolase I